MGELKQKMSTSSKFKLSDLIPNWINYVNGKLPHKMFKKQNAIELFSNPKLSYIQDLFAKIKTTIDDEDFNFIKLLKAKNVSPYDILNNFEIDSDARNFFGKIKEIDKKELVFYFKKFNVYIKLIEHCDDENVLLSDYEQVFPTRKIATIFENSLSKVQKIKIDSDKSKRKHK